MTLVCAAIAPHGVMAIPDACPPGEQPAVRTTEAMRELAARFAAARPASLVVLTPHGVHVEGAMAAVTAGRMAGSPDDAFQSGLGAGAGLRLDCQMDGDLTRALVREVRGAGVPIVGVSYGANDPGQATMPMDWAVLVPLWFLGARDEVPPLTAVLSPARDLSAPQHLAAGRAIRRAIDATERRVAVVASADHGHAHRLDGPYGFHPAAAAYDEQVVSLVREQRLHEVGELDPQLVEDARADSWWQMLLLDGVLGDGWRAELLSYEAPTYFGMLCAIYEPA